MSKNWKKDLGIQEIEMNIDKEREAFEVWNLAGCEMADDPHSGRLDIARYCAWEAWQARAALDEQKAGPSPSFQELLELGEQVERSKDPMHEFIDVARSLLPKYAAPAPKGEPSDDQLLALALELVPNATDEHKRRYGHLWIRLCRMALARFSYAAPANEQNAKDARRYRIIRDLGASFTDYQDHEYRVCEDAMDAVLDAIAQQGTGE